MFWNIKLFFFFVLYCLVQYIFIFQLKINVSNILNETKNCFSFFYRSAAVSLRYWSNGLFLVAACLQGSVGFSRGAGSLRTHQFGRSMILLSHEIVNCCLACGGRTRGVGVEWPRCARRSINPRHPPRSSSENFNEWRLERREEEHNYDKGKEGHSIPYFLISS